MAAAQPSQAVAKRSSETALMPPPPPPKRIKRPTTVLDEDDYTRALSHIIARDYFPGLLETEAQEEYMDALESKDSGWIQDAGKRMREAMTPRRDGQRGRRGVSMTPTGDIAGALETPRGWAGDTPVSIAGTEAPGEDKPEVDLNLSLTAFQAKYTSEDNESFNTSLDKQNAKRTEKYAWLFNGNQIPTARQLAWRARANTKLLEAANHDRGLQQAAPEPLQSPSDNNASAPSPSTSTTTALTTSNPRPAMPLHRPSAPRNALMFHPSSPPHTTTTTTTSSTSSHAPPPSVTHAATRFTAHASEASPATVPASPSLSAIDDAIRGQPRDASSAGSVAGYEGAEAPSVDGWAFVDAERTGAEERWVAGRSGEKDESGVEEENDENDENETRRKKDRKGSSEGEDTEQGLELIRKLQGERAGPNPFTIHAASKREDLHHRLVERQSQQKREIGGTPLPGLTTPRGLGGIGGGTPSATPRFASAAGVKGRAAGGLTPAGERLLRSVGTPRREGLFGQEGRKAWTPTPRVRRKAMG
ncbi:MAG: hypothetical protein M1821_003238 [Bathelium mastoideum]|nr:MAG: hypothetical protein M1821_003238 [Bathelium mastoideum]